MNVTISRQKVSVVRDDVKEKHYTDSSFWYALKKELISMGNDVIKKLMWKDGHMVSDTEYYIRDRKWKFAITDPAYAIRSLSNKFNQAGSVVLTLHDWS